MTIPTSHSISIPSCSTGSAISPSFSSLFRFGDCLPSHSIYQMKNSNYARSFVGDFAMSDRFGQHAVIVGAGIGGLTAAKALASHFEQVTILERDALPSRPEARTGTPQSRQVHVLLRGGLDALSGFFPGFETELEAAGAVRARVGSEIRVESPGFDPFPPR